MKHLISTSIEDVNSQDSVPIATAPNNMATGSAPVLDPHRPNEHSQSSPPPYYSPTDPAPFGSHRSLAQQRHQVSMPHINQYSGHTAGGHMAARCTRSLRSTYCEQEPPTFNFRRNSLVAGSQPNCEREEIIRELSQSPFGCTEPCPETGQIADSASLDGQDVGFLALNEADRASNLNSDSGFENAHSEISQTHSGSDTVCSESPPEMTAVLPAPGPVAEASENSVSTITSV